MTSLVHFVTNVFLTKGFFELGYSGIIEQTLYCVCSRN